MDERSIDERVRDLALAVEQIQSRNARVEFEKAWEVSLTRRVSILVLTYFVVALVMWLIGVREFGLSAIIPTIGYLLSTLSLSLVKRRWLEARGAGIGKEE